MKSFIDYCGAIRNSALVLQAAVVSMLLGFAGTTAADSVFVSPKYNKIFIADRGLFVKDLDTGTANTMCSLNNRWYDPAGHDVTHLLSTATDVIVKHHYAIVTVHPLDAQNTPFVDTITVDLTSCLDYKVVRVDDCIAKVDLEGGFMTIPCVAYNGGYLTVKMNRRGNSNNWEVQTFGDNIHIKNYYGHGHGRKHDRDDDDDD